MLYPDHLHDLHNQMPMAPDKLIVKQEWFSPLQKNILKTNNIKYLGKFGKLVQHLFDRKRYVVHIRNLKYYISKGLILEKIHKGIIFRQENWLMEYIDFNTLKRKEAKNASEINFFKLLNNSVYGR